MASPTTRLVLADVDGTLVTNNKALTSRAIAAAAKLQVSAVLRRRNQSARQ